MDNRRIGIGDSDVIRDGDYGIEVGAIYSIGIFFAVALPFLML